MSAGLVDENGYIKDSIFLLSLFFYNLRIYLYRKKENYGFKQQECQIIRFDVPRVRQPNRQILGSR